MKKRGQLFGIPFSMIFSILLIIFFIVAAGIAIKVVWDPWGGCGIAQQAQQGQFKDKLQDVVSQVWNSAGSDYPNFKIDLPSGIKSVCFLDYNSAKIGKDANLYYNLTKSGEGNLYLNPAKKACKSFRVMKIEHINITKITEKNNPYCVGNNKNLTIKMGYMDKLVTIE